MVFRHVIAALVTNEPGVLAQVAGMFAARGFNIDSLVVGRTEVASLSRMTIVVTGDSSVLEQVRKQLQKLVPVVKVVDYSDTAFVERDLILVKVATHDGEGVNRRGEIIEIANLFRARVVDVATDQLMVELSGTDEKLEAFIDLLQPFGLMELARTGVIAMPRGRAVADRRLTMSASTRGRPGDTPEDGGVDPGDLPPG